jgi:hypothetical protein
MGALKGNLFCEEIFFFSYFYTTPLKIKVKKNLQSWEGNRDEEIENRFRSDNDFLRKDFIVMLIINFDIIA